MENNENKFLEFKLIYDKEKIKENYARIMYEDILSYMKFDKGGKFSVLDKLFIENVLKIKIIKDSNTKFTHHEKKKLKETLLDYIIVSILNSIPDKEAMSTYYTIYTKKGSLFSNSISDNEVMELLESIRHMILNNSNNFSIYKIKEKTQQFNVTMPERDKTILYSVNHISMNELQIREGHIEPFTNTIYSYFEYLYYTINPIFRININDDFDKKELCDLKLLYELKTRAGIRLVDYRFKYKYKKLYIIEIISMTRNYKTINELVNIAKDDYNVAITAKNIKILMSIKNNESDILLEKKVTSYYAELLAIVNLLCKTVDPEYIGLLGLRDISTIEDLYDMCNCVHAGLKKIESNLIESMNILKKNRELAQNKIEEKTRRYEKKVEGVQAAIDHFDTWKIEEEEIKRLHSFQIEYIIDKLRKRNYIKYPWPQYVGKNSQEENEDPQPVEVKSAWVGTNRLVVFILLQTVLISIGIVYLYTSKKQQDV